MIHTIEANAIQLWCDISGASIIALGTLQVDAISLDTLSANFVMFEVVLFPVKD